MTFEEFAAHAADYGREHGEAGTLSVRHLQRLASGRGPDGRPLGALRPATARLLERIFATSIEDLLAPPQSQGDPSDPHPHPLRVAVAVVVREAEVLLVRSRDGQTNGIPWQFPSGIVKPGHAAASVAVAETLAETAVHAAVVRPLGARQHPRTNVLCEYLLCEYVAGNASNADVSENLAVTWVNTARLTRLISPDLIHGPILKALATGAR